MALGIRPEDMPRVFERFWRAPGAAGGGTGLGLAIAKKIVEEHGGSVGAENRADGGFRVRFDRFFSERSLHEAGRVDAAIALRALPGTSRYTAELLRQTLGGRVVGGCWGVS